MKFQEVVPDELRLIWPDLVRPMIERVRERCQARWLAEDVYASVVGEISKLYLWLDHEEEPVGVVVVNKTRTWGEDTLDVWVVYHDPRDQTSSVKDLYPWLREIARQEGCTVIQSEGPRPNHKVLPGLTVLGYQYEVRV